MLSGFRRLSKPILKAVSTMPSNQHIWVASYPKSGNTWVRFLVSNLIFGPITDSQSIEQMIPDIHRPLEGQKVFQFQNTIFMKTHWKYDPEITARFPTRGAIYIVRNPLDVIASHINYFGLREDTRQQERAAFIDTFIRNAGHQRWFRFKMGSWNENVESWALNQLGFPRLVLRYEDLKSDTHAAVGKIVRFLGLDKSREQIDEAVRRSTFDSLRSIEEKELGDRKNGFFSTEHRHKSDTGYRFMNKGKIGTFQEVMHPKQIRDAMKRFEPVMKKLGYQVKLTYRT